MKKKVLTLLLLAILMSTYLFAANIKIHSNVNKDDAQYTAYLAYLPNHIFSQFTHYYDSEYDQYKSQFVKLNSADSFKIDPDDLRNNDSKKMNGSFILVVDALSEDHRLRDQYFDVVVYTNQFYYINNGLKTPTEIEVKVYDNQYKLITKDSDGGYRISARTYISIYKDRAVKHFYLGWTGKKNLIPGRYETDFTFKIIDQT
jgi:hypothetical protein